MVGDGNLSIFFYTTHGSLFTSAEVFNFFLILLYLLFIYLFFIDFKFINLDDI